VHGSKAGLETDNVRVATFGDPKPRTLVAVMVEIPATPGVVVTLAGFAVNEKP
jgi:hypothetical protein